jgi:hypothetical protein
MAVMVLAIHDPGEPLVFNINYVQQHIFCLKLNSYPFHMLYTCYKQYSKQKLGLSNLKSITFFPSYYNNDLHSSIT